jgi:hypothetical protein
MIFSKLLRVVVHFLVKKCMLRILQNHVFSKKYVLILLESQSKCMSMLGCSMLAGMVMHEGGQIRLCMALNSTTDGIQFLSRE